MRSYTYLTNMLFSISRSGEHEPDVRISYTVTPGCAETRTNPACGPEVEIDAIEIKTSTGWTAIPDAMFEMIRYDDELLGQLVENAAEDDVAAADDAAERRYEMNRERDYIDG